MISAGASTMLLTRKASSKYSLLPDSDSPAQTTEKPLRSRLLRSSYALTGFLLISSILVLVVLLTPKPRSTCTQPRLRQEWRTLSHDERQSYLAAARCLTRVPSSSLPNATIHDEFSLIHSRVGNYSHDAAPFLPWHRFFIHAYEAALQEHCQYDGIAPCVSPVDVQHVTVPANQAPRYWDWSLDYQNLLKSPIWSTDEGFGPDGDKGTSSNMNPNPNPSTSVNGHCVVDGPFAGLTPVYYDGEYQPHCLSRGFLDEETVKKVGNLTMRPSVLQELVRNESSYFDFLLRVETMSHLTIPYVVQGDFRTVTAPNDPVFYLHHGQVDRLWWSWQQMSSERKIEYNGPARNDDPVDADVNDELDFGGLFPSLARVTVGDVMDTESGVLCYQYDRSILE